MISRFTALAALALVPFLTSCSSEPELSNAAEVFGSDLASAFTAKYEPLCSDAYSEVMLADEVHSATWVWEVAEFESLDSLVEETKGLVEATGLEIVNVPAENDTVKLTDEAFLFYAATPYARSDLKFFVTVSSDEYENCSEDGADDVAYFPLQDGKAAIQVTAYLETPAKAS